MAFHHRNQFLSNKRHRHEKRREKQAGEGENDFDSMRFQPCAAGAVFAEQKNEKEADDDWRDGKRQIENGHDESFAWQFQMGDAPCETCSDYDVERDGTERDEQR